MILKKRCGTVTINNTEAGSLLRDISQGGWFQALDSYGKPDGMIFGKVLGPPDCGQIPYQSFDLSLNTPMISNGSGRLDLPVWPLTLVSMDFTFKRI
jgi:hypothetical protein